jgi:flagellin
MRINNNMMAINAHRQLGVTNNASAKTLEKLSSGLRINRAGDDAAGLAISEKMRGQIRGLNMASKNAQDGISLIQTAEGALTETHAILQRMRELAVQSANDTNVEVDRGEIQKEIDQLAAEITRISETTQFNTQDLLTGKFGAKFHIGANSGQNVDLAINDMSAKALNVQGKAYKATEVTGATNIEVTSKTGEALSIEFADLKTGAGHEAVTDTTADFDEENNKIIIKLKQAAYDTDNTKDGAIEATEADIKAALDTVASEAGISVAVKDGATLGETALTTIDPTKDKTTVNVTVIDKDASKKVGIDVSSQTKADTSITTINKAIEQVSAERSKLGAMQNRLEHSIKNLDTSAENLQAAESRIRDVDYAEAA